MVWPLLVAAFAGGGAAAGTAGTAGGVTAGSVLFYGSAVGTGVAGGLYLGSRSRAKECVDCQEKKWRIVAHAQGSDVGGTSSSTVSAGALEKSSPVLKAEGIMKLTQVREMLENRQRNLRELAFAKAVAYIQTHAYLGKKSFEVRGASGGARYDVDSYGPSDNFVA